MGLVLLATKAPTAAIRRKYSSLGGRIALKAPLVGVSPEKEKAIFKRELTIWAGLRHNSILSLLDILYGEDGNLFAAMDWCDGSLRDLMRKKHRFSLSESLHIIAHMLCGLLYANEKDKVLHLDIKPENVIYRLGILRDKNVSKNQSDILKYEFMISDWGIASVKTQRIGTFLEGNASVSTEETFNNMGTMHYMAPERFCAGTSSSIASDIYSLGMVFYELMTGSLPVTINAIPAYQVREIKSFDYYHAAIQEIGNHDISSHYTKVILSMIHPQPSIRPKSYHELGNALMTAGRKENNLFSRIFK